MKTFTKFLGIVMILALVLGFIPARTASAASDIVYDAVPATLAPNYPSVGFQATSTFEFGDYIHLAGTNRLLKTVTVTMSAWALQADYPGVGDSAGWDHPITLNIYGAVPGTPNSKGSLLATKTQTFHIPWRPVGDDTCPMDYPPNHAWKAGNGLCYNGFAFNITFNLGSLNVTLPDDIVIGIAYNTNTWGYNPIGLPGPYESLNVGALPGPASKGTDDSTDKVFLYSMWGGAYEGADKSTGTFREDTNWIGYGTLPIEITADAQVVVPVYVLGPSWTTPGGEGVYAAYYGPLYYLDDPQSPGSTALFDGREAGIIKAGIIPDSDNVTYYDEGLLGFQVPNLGIAEFAAQALMYDVQNASGTNPVWVRIRLVGGTTYQFVPAPYAVGAWHTIAAAAGEWQLMDSNGNATGPKMSLSTLAASIPSALVDRVYLTLGIGNSYNVSPGVGTVGWVDKVTIGSTTYDFLVEDTCTTDCYVSTTGSDSNAGNEFSPFLTIQKGINTVSVGGTVHVEAGTYYGGIMIDKALTLQSVSGAATTTIHGGLSAASAMYVVSIRANDVTLDGFTITSPMYNNLTGSADATGIMIGYYGDNSMSNIRVTNNIVTQIGAPERVLDTTDDYPSVGIVVNGVVAGLEIDHNTIHDIHQTVTNPAITWGPTGIGYYGYDATPLSTNVSIHDNLVYDISANYVSPVAPISNGIRVGWGSGDASVLNNTVHNIDGRGIVATSSNNGVVAVTGNTVYGNAMEGIYLDNALGGSVHFNRIVSNDVGVYSATAIDATNNWFGCNEGPSDPDCDSVSSLVDADPWLVMSVTDLPATIAPLGTAAFTADLSKNNLDVDPAGDLPATTSVGFTPIDDVEPDSDLLTLSLAETTFTAPVAPGTPTEVCAVLDNATVCDTVTTTSPTIVYVDDDFTATISGGHIWGYDAFASIQAAVDAVAPGTPIARSTVNVSAGTYPESVEITKTGLDILMPSGVTVAPTDGACFTIQDSYTRIFGDYLGAKCELGMSGFGIMIFRDDEDPIEDVIIDGIEIDGNSVSDIGIFSYINISDVQIINNYIHDLNAEIMYLQGDILGTFDVQGNLFKNNARGIAGEGPSGTPYNFQYNSWGNYTVTSGMVNPLEPGLFVPVDFDPWTHVDLFLESSGTPWLDQVMSGNTITYAVKANLVNAMGAEFTLKFPADLTVASTSLGGTFDTELPLVLTADSIAYRGYQMGEEAVPPVPVTAVTGQDLTLFTVTFNAPTAGTYALDLDETSDVFSMAPGYGPSLNIYASELADGEVHVIDSPVLSSTNLAGPYVAGILQEFNVTLTNPDLGGTFSNVLVNFTIADAVLADIYSFEYFDGSAWRTLPLTQVGSNLVGSYGPSVGFPMPAPYNATSLFRIVVAEPGTYAVTVQLVDLATNPDAPLATLNVDALVNGNFTIMGEFYMQGRYLGYRGDIPVALTKIGLPVFGPYSGSTIDVDGLNLTLLNVNAGEYLITTNQPRYLNLDASSGRTVNITADRNLTPLRLWGGNAFFDNEIDISDAGVVAAKFLTGTIDDDADVNFDGVVNVQDMALVGGNYDKTSDTAYDFWTP